MKTYDYIRTTIFITPMQLCCLGNTFVPQIASQILILKQEGMEPCNLARSLHIVFSLTTFPLKILDYSFAFHDPRVSKLSYGHIKTIQQLWHYFGRS